MREFSASFRGFFFLAEALRLPKKKLTGGGDYLGDEERKESSGLERKLKCESHKIEQAELFFTEL